VDNIGLFSDPHQLLGVFESGVAAAGDRYGLPGIKRRITSGAIGNASPFVLFFTGAPKLLVGFTRDDNHRPGRIGAPGGLHRMQAAFAFQFNHWFIFFDWNRVFLYMLFEFIGQFGAGDHLKAHVVFHVPAPVGLAADVPGHDQNVQAFTGRVNCGADPGRARPGDDKVIDLFLVHSANPSSSLIFLRSNPMTIWSSISRTGTPIWPVFSIISSMPSLSVATLISS